VPDRQKEERKESGRAATVAGEVSGRRPSW